MKRAAWWNLLIGIFSSESLCVTSGHPWIALQAQVANHNRTPELEFTRVQCTWIYQMSSLNESTKLRPLNWVELVMNFVPFSLLLSVSFFSSVSLWFFQNLRLKFPNSIEFFGVATRSSLERRNRVGADSGECSNADKESFRKRVGNTRRVWRGWEAQYYGMNDHADGDWGMQTLESTENVIIRLHYLWLFFHDHSLVVAHWLSLTSWTPTPFTICLSHRTCE